MLPLEPDSTLMSSFSTYASLEEAPTRYQACFFGPFRLMVDGKPVPESWRRNKAKTLLKWFVLNPSKPYSVNQLIHYFWKDSAPDMASRNFRVTMHYLRHVLEPELARNQKSTFIARNQHNCYWFEPYMCWQTDVARIDHLYAHACACDQDTEETRVLTYYQEIAYYCAQGFLPEDIYEDVFRSYRYHYECIYMRTLKKLIEIYARQQVFDDVLFYAQRLLNLDPWNEFAVEAIVEAHLQQGNKARAHNALTMFIEDLKEEGVEKSMLLRLKEKL